MRLKRLRFRLRRTLRRAGVHAVYVIAAGFALLILLGGVLLSMPFASINGRSIGFFDALFTSTSAVCVTGLVVRDTATTFNLFGRIVLLLLIQVGGLGFMTFATLLFRAIGRHMTLSDRMLIRESMNEETLGGMDKLIRWVALSAFIVELTGAVLLSFRMIPRFGFWKGAFYSLFHAVSAFCNAGFDLFGHYSSLTGYAGDVLMNLTVAALVVIGGLGFGVLNDLQGGFRRLWRLRLHTRLVLCSYGVLLGFGFLFTLAAEWSNPGTLGPMPVGEKLLAALFQSVTLRTAGFNTINEGLLHPATKLVSCMLMVVGASPASTGGGVKVTTLAVAFLLVRMAARGEDSISLFKRRLPPALVQRAMAVLLLAISVMLADTIAISLMQPELEFMDIMFECSSAIGTVGLSIFGSASLNPVSRTLIMLTMYIGRIGPLTAALVLAHRQGANRSHFNYPEGHIMIG